MGHDAKGVQLAAALLLLWLAGVAFFVAFHPGGIQMPGGESANNPVDVLKYLLTKGGEGAPGNQTQADTSGGSGAANPGGTLIV